MRLRRGLVFAVLVAGVAVVAVWRWHRAQEPRAGDTVSLGGGAVTFRMPQGWQRVDCPGGASGCVYLRTPRGTDDAIAAMVVTPPAQKSAGDVTAAVVDPATAAGGRAFEVDGAPFARARTNAATVVRGRLDGGDEVFITCIDGSEGKVVRAGCEVVVGSLHVGR